MNPQQLFERIRAASATLSTRQMVTIALLFVAVVVLMLGSTYWINTPSYTVLFSDLDAESAGSVVAKLKTDKVPYEVADGGRTVRVPAAQVDELRLGFASSGMPSSGRIGFEIFDRTAFGVTDFMEHINYQRALEGELARTISTISDVSGARVHLAIPQASVFSERQQPVTASVVLKLRSNKALSESTVNAITGLVAASVESLKPESVVLIDNFGRPLARQASASGDGLSGQELERQVRVERDLSDRVVALLEPLVGLGRARVNVTAKISTDSKEETEERFDPAPVVRSRQSVTQTGTSTAVQGIAGARANLPPDESGKPTTPPPVAATTPGPNGSQTAETTNYEVGKLTVHRIQPQGQIARLSVAVVLDEDREPAAAGSSAPGARKPRSAAEIQKIKDLVGASVGLDPARGDQLTVESMAFEEVAVEELPTPTMWQQYQAPALEIGRVLGAVIVFALVLFGFVRPVIKGSLPKVAPAAPVMAAAAAAPGLGPGLPRTVQDLESHIDAQLQAEADQAGHRRLPALTKRVATLTQREPENAARLLRTWLTEDQGQK